MATLNIGGKRVTVDDSFLSLPAEQQAATVEEISSSLGATAQPAAAAPQPPQTGNPQSFEDLPWYSKLGVAADDTIRILANAATLGAADKIAGYLGGQGQEAEQKLTQGARDRAGGAAIATDVLGTALPTGLAMKAGGAAVKVGGNLVSKAAPAVSTALAAPGLALRTAGAGIVGGGIGATEAAIKGEDIGTGATLGALGGAGGNLIGEGVTKVVGKVAGAFNKAPKVATNEELRSAANAAYQKADDAGVVFTPDAVARLKTDIQTKLAEKAYSPKLQPRVQAALEEIDRLEGQNVTLKGLDTLRQIAKDTFDPMNKKSGMLGEKIISKIDDLIANPKANEVLMGDAQAGSLAVKEARELWSRLSKSEALDNAVARADLRAASTGSGGNVDNATRQNVRALLEKSKGLKPDERAAMEQVVRGTKAQNLARALGKLSPSGNGLALLLHGTGGVMSGGATLPLAVVGAGAKSIADRATPQNVKELSRILRAGGDASATRAAPNAVQRLSEAKREAIIRLLTTSGISLATN